MNQQDSELFARANTFTRGVIGGLKAEQWTLSTNCEWDVRGVVNHIVLGNKFGVEFINGRLTSNEEAAPLRSQDHLGKNPLRAYDQAFKQLDKAFRQPGFAERTLTLPYMPAPVPGSQFIMQRLTEVLLHGWDISRATGQSDKLDPELCRVVYDCIKPAEQMLRESGSFGPHIEVPRNASIQKKMLALFGRAS